MDGKIHHQITYRFDGTASVEEVAASLIAQERLLNDAIRVIEACFDGLLIEKVQVSVKAVSQESPLKEVLAGLILLSYQEELLVEIPPLIEKLFGVQLSDQYDATITVVVLVAAIYGASALYEKIMAKDKDKTLVEELARLSTEACKRLGVSEERFQEALISTLGKGRKRSVIKSAMDFFRPAQTNKAKGISGFDEVEIPQKVIASVPDQLDLEQYEPETDQYLVQNVEIQFSQHDIDRPKNWACIVPSVSPDRKKLHVDPSINVDFLFEKKRIRGDVVVTATENSEGEMEPTLYYLQSFQEPD